MNTYCVELRNGRRQLGIQESVDENWGVFLCCWLLTWPFVIFQSLLCAYDDSIEARSRMTHTEIIIPLLLVLGWALLTAVAMVVQIKTSFESARPQKLSAFAGVADIYIV